MQAVAPDLVADLCGLSLGPILLGGIVGFALWLFGWRSHRFWVALAATVAAGVYGLQQAEAFKTPPLVAAILLAVTAGVLALALVRLLAFAVGGTVGVFIIQAASPTLDLPLVVFLVSGLVSLLLYRWFLMAITSFGGSVLLCYSCLAFLHLNGSLDAAAWSEQSATFLNGVCGLGTVVGFLFQFLTGRRRRNAEEDAEGSGLLLSFQRFYRRAG